ncbi:aminopeptidase, partial [Ectopseudomonas khazarica]
MPDTFSIDILRRLAVPLLALLLGGCSTLDYYAHLGQGQWQLLQAREPVERLLQDPQTTPELARRLALSQQARDFASASLRLPDNRSYRLYADLKRPFVVWNVFAT